MPRRRRLALFTGFLAAVWILVGACFVPAGAAQENPDEAWLTAPALHGMTGLVNIPTAYVIPSGALRVGVGWLDQEWAYQPRLSPPPGAPDLRSDNHQYFLTFGFISRVEVSIRATYFPSDAFTGIDPQGTVDRGGNARIQVLTEGRTRPAVALGIDDIRGTRKFHALYAVGSKEIPIQAEFLRVRLTAGYGSDALDATSYLLRGWFGGGRSAWDG